MTEKQNRVPASTAAAPAAKPAPAGAGSLVQSDGAAPPTVTTGAPVPAVTPIPQPNLALQNRMTKGGRGPDANKLAK